jgi:hypothetical protein
MINSNDAYLTTNLETNNKLENIQCLNCLNNINNTYNITPANRMILFLK